MVVSRVATPDEIIVRVMKYDGTEYRRWRARLTRRQEALIVLEAEFEIRVNHHSLGEIARGTRTIEYYWLDRWYNVFRFLNDDCTTRLYYCNINLPPALEAGVLSYIDLDIDILVQPNLSVQVLDSDEFEANARRYDYSEEVKKNARAAVAELTAMIETREFPFTENVLNSLVSPVVNYS